MGSDNLGDKIAGAGQKIAGETEQSLDNMGIPFPGSRADLKVTLPLTLLSAQVIGSRTAQTMLETR